MLHLMTTPEEELATTLIMLPFAYDNFEEFYHFSIELEDDIIPRLERLSNPTYASSSIEKEVQLAAFHPSFQFAGADFNDPLNFEKRAPFPTLNLLRAERVRVYSSQKKSTCIAESNEETLLNIGSEKLIRDFERIVKLALD